MNGDVFTADEMSKQNRDNVAKALALAFVVLKIDLKDFSRVRSSIPPVVKPIFNDTEWEETLRRITNQIGKISETTAQRMFLDVIKTYKAYGSSFFHMTASTDVRCEAGCIVAINSQGVMMIDSRTRVKRF